MILGLLGALARRTDTPACDRCPALETELAAVTAQRDALQRARRDGNLGGLVNRLADLEAENARLRAAVASGGLEDLLRERDTNRRLEAEVHRLTYASIAADKGPV